jgi:hypothetical protein
MCDVSFIEKDLKTVFKLAPGQSAPFLFYTIYFIDLTKPESFPPTFTVERLVKSSKLICRASGAGGGLSDSYISKAAARSQYIIVAIDNYKSIGSFVLARVDEEDKKGIYVEASCNTPSTYSSVTRTPDEYTKRRKAIEDMVAKMSDDECISKLRELGKNVIIGAFKLNESLYRGTIVKKTIEQETLVDDALKPITMEINIRTAQLLKLVMFKYANTQGFKHVYNSAASLAVMQFHSRNGMVLRSSNCDSPDSIADEFAGLKLDQRGEFTDNLVKSGKFKLDKTQAYPMKLCNYDFDILAAEALDHTLNVMIKACKKGFTIEEVNSIRL